MSKRSGRCISKILSVLLYALPVLFFIICYFVIITSGEDIFQGAGTPPNIINDALAAFAHSARLADMYAWAVINFFDYQYAFGIDTIFRILDVVVAVGIFYMITYIILRRRPQLCLKDSLIFCVVFLLVFLTSNGLTLYAGFSKIHNYLFIAFFSLLFGIFYLRDLWGQKNPNSIWFAATMLVLGFIFGIASNITAVVFLLSLVAYGVYLLIRKQKIPWRKFLCSWRLLGAIGALIGLGIIYIVGNGLADYETSQAYLVVCDYIPLSHLFDDIPLNTVRIFKHIVYNFGKFLLPFLVVSTPLVITFLVLRRKKLITVGKFSQPEQKFLIGTSIFIVMHLLAVSQIYYPTRLLLPAYLIAIAAFIVVVRHFAADLKVKKISLVPFAVVAIFLCMGLIVVRSYFAITYVNRISPVLDEIKNSQADSLCVEPDVARAEYIPYIHLGQEDFLVDWAMPQTIYDKTIYFCQH